VDGDGRATVLELAPAAPPEELERLEGELGLPLPRELRATLELTMGIEGSAPSLGRFLHETFRMSIPPHASLVDDVHDDRLFRVWRENPGATARSDALSADDDLRGFAEQLDDRFQIVDLRSPEIGMGFSWGRYGPRTDVRRHGFLRLFAYARPERKPGLVRRIFG